MSEQLVIIGAGGHGREVLDVVEAINRASAGAQRFEVLGFLDDGSPHVGTLEPYGVQHLGRVVSLDDMSRAVQYVIAIGSPQVRREIDEHFQATRKSPVLVHPTASYARAVTFGPGTIAFAGVRMTNNIRLGRHVHLNVNSTVSHDARLGNYVTVSPLAAITGNVTLADEVMIGTGASLNPGVYIGRGATIGSGATVLRDVDAGVTAVGVPASPR